MQYASTTTLAAIRAAHPCEDGWRKLLGHLGKTAADDEAMPLLTVLDSNGLDDALWVLSKAMPDDRLARHFGAWCAEHRPVDLTGEAWDAALLLSTRTGDHRPRMVPRVRHGRGVA